MLMPLLTCLMVQAPSPTPQPVPSPPVMNPERQLQRLQEALHLADAQVPKVRQILDAQARQAELDRAEAGGDRRALLKATRARMDTMDKAMTGVLTPDQMAAYNQLKEQAKTRLRQQRQAGGAPDPQ